MKLKLISKKREVGNVKTFVFEPEQPLVWVAGQFMHYTLPKLKGATDNMKRFFTISSPPHTGKPQISTRVTESAFKQALNAMKVGDFIEATEPEGDFVWQDSDKPIVFIAGGIGVTPFHSILLDRDYHSLPLNLTLIYASRDDKIVFKEEFDALAQKYPELKIKYIVGESLTADLLVEAEPNLKGSLVYLSGAEPMVEAIGDELRAKHGLTDDQFKQDFFPGYTEQTF